MDSQHNLSAADYDLEYEYDAVREPDFSLEKALIRYVMPTLLVVGLVCNVLTIIVVSATASLRGQSRGIYVLVMAVLDIWMLVATVTHILTSVNHSWGNGLFSTLHGCRFTFFTYRFPLASLLLLPMLGLEICLARNAPAVGRKLSTPQSAGLVTFALISFVVLESLMPFFNVVDKCNAKDFSLHVTIIKIDLAILYVGPFLVLAVECLLLLCGLSPSRGLQDSDSAQRSDAERAQPPYRRFDQTTSTMTGDVRSDGARATSATRNLALPIVSCVFYAVFILPLAVSLILLLTDTVDRLSFSLYRFLHVLLVCFYEFKLFVYIIGWDDFRTRFAQLARKMFPCRQVRSSPSSSEEGAAIVLDMVPSDVRTTSTDTDRLETLS